MSKVLTPMFIFLLEELLSTFHGMNSLSGQLSAKTFIFTSHLELSVVIFFLSTLNTSFHSACKSAVTLTFVSL